MAQKILGKDKLGKIFKKYNLGKEEEKNINYILRKWDRLRGRDNEDNEKEIGLAFKKKFSYSQRKVFYCALVEICTEFTMAKIRMKMH